MKLFRLSLLLLFLTGVGRIDVSAQSARETAGAAWEASLVQIEVTRKQQDYTQPWMVGERKVSKTGIVISSHEILTTADDLFDRTLVRLQKGGRGRWWNNASVAWIDYYANLALVTVPDADFWTGLKPAALAAHSAVEEGLQIVRWQDGKIENRKAEFGQFTVDEGKLSFAPYVQMELSSEMQAIGFGEPVVSGTNVVALITSREATRIRAIPTSFIRSVLDSRASGAYAGLGYFPFFWETAINTETLNYLKLPGEPRGVVVTEVPNKPGQDQTLKPMDILLQIDGFDIDVEGDYADPDYGPLLLENLANRGKRAGEELKMKIWREGQTLDISYKIPKANYTDSLTPAEVYDQDPEYLIVGGLIFQPLNDPYLKSWGVDWKRRSPFRLYYYNEQSPSRERPALVILSSVLPDSYNLGYQDYTYLVLDQVNGMKISYLSQLQEALKHPVNGFHDFRFVHGDTIRRVILDAAQTESATRRVLERYQVPQEALVVPHVPIPVETEK